MNHEKRGSSRRRENSNDQNDGLQWLQMLNLPSPKNWKASFLEKCCTTTPNALAHDDPKKASPLQNPPILRILERGRKFAAQYNFHQEPILCGELRG
jgi:hypothetical protein